MRPPYLVMEATRTGLATLSAAACGLILAAFVLGAGCAHQASALAITGTTLDGAGITFEAVEAGMHSASDAHVLTAAQVEGWNDFLARWKVAYPNACAAWRAAKAKGDDSGAEQAAAALAELLGQLNSWATVLTEARKP